MHKYVKPRHWLRYDPLRVASELAEAKAAVLSLTTIPYQRRWVEALQEVQLKREVAGTSRIEGAEFTERELDDADCREARRSRFLGRRDQARSRFAPVVVDPISCDAGRSYSRISGLRRRPCTRVNVNQVEAKLRVPAEHLAGNLPPTHFDLPASILKLDSVRPRFLS